MHILLIEDDKFVAEFEKRVLKDHKVLHVTGLHDAITAKLSQDLSQENPFELVILDLRLPRKIEYKGEKYYDPKEVIKTVDEKFKGIPIVIVSAFIDDEVNAYALEHRMFCIDKTFLSEGPAFIQLLNAATGVSKNMRSETAFLQHLTRDAVACADDDKETEMERTKAKLYLYAGTTVILLPWLMIGYMMIARSILHDTEPIPYYTEILLFCGIAIASIIGVLPWFLKYFKIPGGDSESK